ncbi:MAG: hypothetical protein ABWY05_13170 [Noviherbaspirillum sp.]
MEILQNFLARAEVGQRSKGCRQSPFTLAFNGRNMPRRVAASMSAIHMPFLSLNNQSIRRSRIANGLTDQKQGMRLFMRFGTDDVALIVHRKAFPKSSDAFHVEIFYRRARKYFRIVLSS